MKKETVKERVKKDILILKKIETYKGLRKFASEQGYTTSRFLFANFKRALLEHDIDYEKIRETEIKKSNEKIQKKAKKEFTVYMVSSSNDNKFAIYDQDKQRIWVGKLQKPAYRRNDAELETAKKVIWIAKKIKEIHKLKAVKVNIYIYYKFLTTANCKNGVYIKRHTKARHIALWGKNENIEIEFILTEKKPNIKEEKSINWKKNILNIKLKDKKNPPKIMVLNPSLQSSQE